ncbi:hypothetical protein RRG08_047776 [Elysia crispata]|uniref:Uncharacterized protein n=1 Tax=Elysia crispata TaxID=231223 RepID=A0AAE1D669_9GAST|nr:hypothetical protein RRG08_047776 [Elysia crispata]
MDSREELAKDLPSHKFGLQDLDLELAGCRSFLGTGRRAGTHRLPVTYELCPRQGSRVLSRLRPRKGDRRSRGGLGSRGEHCLGRHTGQDISDKGGHTITIPFLRFSSCLLVATETRASSGGHKWAEWFFPSLSPHTLRSATQVEVYPTFLGLFFV